MGNYCEQVVHSRYLQLGLQPTTGQRSPSPPGGRDRRGRSPAVGTYEGWVTSYGVCGHLLDSLSVWGHSASLSKPEQAQFGRFYGIMFFRQDSLKSEGRCHTHPRINTRPGRIGSRTSHDTVPHRVGAPRARRVLRSSRRMMCLFPVRSSA